MGVAQATGTSGAKFSRPVRLEPGMTLAGFTCGNEVVDSWAENYAGVARQRGTAVVYVSYCDSRVAGFYSLSTHSVLRSDVQGGWLVRNAPMQIPAVLLGMLGVDLAYKGQGLGAALLRDAILNAVKVAQIAGARALIVDPVDEDSRRFYRHFGFCSLVGSTRMAIKLPHE